LTLRTNSNYFCIQH